jgi:hypothetical protein
MDINFYCLSFHKGFKPYGFRVYCPLCLKLLYTVQDLIYCLCVEICLKLLFTMCEVQFNTLLLQKLQ